MTAMPRDLARRRPANLPLLPVDEMHEASVNQEEMRVLLTALATEARKRAACGSVTTAEVRTPSSKPSDLGTRVLMRLFALACMAGAVYMIVCAATGNRP